MDWQKNISRRRCQAKIGGNGCYYNGADLTVIKPVVLDNNYGPAVTRAGTNWFRE